MFDTRKALKRLRSRALPGSNCRCAQYTQEAIEAGGIILQRSPLGAKDYGASLVKAGFRTVLASEKLQAGDVVIIEAVADAQYGHMAMFDGTQWISDFKQWEFWPGPAYRSGTAKFVIYRYRGRHKTVSR